MVVRHYKQGFGLCVNGKPLQQIRHCAAMQARSVFDAHVDFLRFAPWFLVVLKKGPRALKTVSPAFAACILSRVLCLVETSDL